MNITLNSPELIGKHLSPEMLKKAKAELEKPYLKGSTVSYDYGYFYLNDKPSLEVKVSDPSQYPEYPELIYYKIYIKALKEYLKDPLGLLTESKEGTTDFVEQVGKLLIKPAAKRSKPDPLLAETVIDMIKQLKKSEKPAAKVSKPIQFKSYTDDLFKPYHPHNKYIITRPFPYWLPLWDKEHITGLILKNGHFPDDYHEASYIQQGSPVSKNDCYCCTWELKYIKPVMGHLDDPYDPFPITVEADDDMKIKKSTSSSSTEWIEPKTKIKIKKPAVSFKTDLYKLITKRRENLNRQGINCTYVLIDEKRFWELAAIEEGIQKTFAGLTILPVPTKKNKPYLRLVAVGTVQFPKYYQFRKQQKKYRKIKLSLPAGFKMPEKIL